MTPGIVARILAGALSLVCAAGAFAADWKPSRNVEILVPSSPGGAQDRTARVIQAILQGEKLLESVSLNHKPGAGHAVAAAILAQRPGDGHLLLTSTSTLLTTHILGVNRFSYTDFTPVAMLSSEYVGFAVAADGPIRTGADLVERLKADPQSVAFAFGTSRGNVNHIGVGQVLKAAGLDPARARAVVYKASPEAMSALLGGHVDCVAAPLSNFSTLMKGGKVRVVAVAAPRRSEGAFAAVPTWKELGWPAESDNFRMVLGAKGLSAAQTAFWDGAFSRLTQHPEWKRDLESNGLTPRYLASAEAATELKRRYAEYRDVLAGLGLAK